MDFTLPTPETDIVDTYAGLSLTVPAIPGKHAAAEITTVKVSLTVAHQDSPEEDLVAGDILASVDLGGHRLTAQGARNKSAGYGAVFGVSDEEARWEIARAALLASCERHGLNPTKVVDHSIATFAEKQAVEQARMLKSFGITGS